MHNSRTPISSVIDLSQARDYLNDACDLEANLESEHKITVSFLDFDALLKDPHLIPAGLDGFNKWKAKYVHAYRKAHRAYYGMLEKIRSSAESVRPRVDALSRINTIVELGAPLAATLHVAADLKQLDSLLWICPDAAEAKITGTKPLCPKCDWTPAKALPQKEFDRLATTVAQGLDDRFLRFKDASIFAIIKRAAAEKQHDGLKRWSKIIPVATADKLADVMTGELVSFLRQLLYDENIVHESVALAPILQQVGAVEEDRVEEAVSKFSGEV